MIVTLDVNKRVKGNGRSPDSVPGVVYGPKQPSIALTIDVRAMAKVLVQAGESTIIVLKGLTEDLEVLIQEVTFNVERGGIEHVDFYAIESGKELTTNVALEFINEAPAEKMGATVNKVLHDIEVTCRPSDLPSHLDVDISVLVNEHSQIRVSDLKLPSGVKVENDPEDVVVNIVAAREEEEIEEVDMTSVEVESKGKVDGEEANN